MAEINKDGVLAGKVVVVTGASRGIGEAIALRYAMEGASLSNQGRGAHVGSTLNILQPLPDDVGYAAREGGPIGLGVQGRSSRHLVEEDGATRQGVRLGGAPW